MNENWTVNRGEDVERAQAVWDALAAGDPAPVLESQASGIIFDNGPGAGPWRHTEGQAAFLDMIGAFFPIFGESFRQVGTCIFANEQFAITLVGETGEHAGSGDVFDNRAIYVSRLDADGKTDRVWTVDLDSEDMERFWQRNPVEVNASGDSDSTFGLATVCIDCADADAMAGFYGRLLGWDVTFREPGWVLMRDPNGGTGLSFQAEERYRAPAWPEQPGGQDKMLHLDIKVDDLDAAVAHALASGARLAEHQPQARVRVLLDPADHPFCLFLD